MAQDEVAAWSAISCALLLIGGILPQANSATVGLGPFGSATFDTGYVVSGKIYVCAALLAAGGLVAFHRQADPARWTIKLKAIAALAAMMCSLFSYLEISETSQITPVTAGFGLYVVLVASQPDRRLRKAAARRQARVQLSRYVETEISHVAERHSPAPSHRRCRPTPGGARHTGASAAAPLDGSEPRPVCVRGRELRRTGHRRARAAVKPSGGVRREPCPLQPVERRIGA
jgi:hypothetical protein